MRIRQYLTLSLLLIDSALIATLLSTNVRPTHAQMSNREQSTGAPATVDSQSAMTLTLVITNAAPIVNQAVQVTVTLTNHTTSTTFETPRYTLQLDSGDEASILVPVSPQIQHVTSVAPAAVDVASFDLYPVGGGSITATAGVGVTIQQTPTAQTTIGAQSESITLNVPPPSPETAVIHEVAYSLGCMNGDPFATSSFATGADWAKFDCALAPGHAFGSSLTRYTSDEFARDLFNEQRGELPLTGFYCRLAFEWSERPPNGPITESDHSWVAERWLTNSSARDDTEFGISPKTVSEAVYRAMRARELIEPCTDAYLPLVSR